MLDEAVHGISEDDQPVTGGEMVLPGQWRDIVRSRGPLPSHPLERRRHPRYWFPKAAVLEVDQSLPAVAREHTFERILVKDISRSGVAFVNRFPLYPGEQVRLVIDGGALSVVIARCRRLNSSCFEIGAELLAPPPADVEQTIEV